MIAIDCVHCGRSLTVPEKAFDGDEFRCICGGACRLSCDAESVAYFHACEDPCPICEAGDGDPIAVAVRRAVATYLDPLPADDEALPLDSLAIVDVVLLVEEEVGPVPDAANDARTIAGIVAAIKAGLRAPGATP